MSRASVRTALVSGAAVIALGVAGCSSGTSSPEPTAPAPAVSAADAAFVSRAADTTTKAGSARLATTTTIQGIATSAGSNPTTVTANGVVNFGTRQLDLAVEAAVMGSTQRVRVVVTGDHTYIQMPMLGEKWLDAPIQDLGVNVANPTSGLAQLKEVADLQNAGTEQIDGRTATKYNGTLDLRKALAQSGIPDAQLKQLADELSKVGKTAQVTVWVDEQNRIVRYDQVMTIDTGNGSPLTVDTSTTLSEFGVATDIKAPPPGQTVDLNQLRQSGQLPDLSGATAG